MNATVDIPPRPCHMDELLRVVRGERADPRRDQWVRRVSAASRACCCPAPPAVVAIMPPRPGRYDPVDLLLCGHHYRAAQASLDAAGARIYSA